MIDLIKTAISKGAKIYGSVSGGKGGQAMAKSLHNWGFEITGLIHADLGRTEWKQSLPMCEALASELNVKLHIVKRRDGLDMLDIWQRRMKQLQGTGKPFWSSSANRYCTSDLKRDPINVFFRNCGNDFVISCEGIRAEESTARAKKVPLTIREKVSSSFYKGMTVEEAIANFTPGKKLALTWFPIFNYSTADVWNVYGVDEEILYYARQHYKQTGEVLKNWPFHPAYIFGNERVSCVFCVLASRNDLHVGAEHAPELLNTLVQMEEESGATFVNKWSLKNLLP
jgi:3'-phosphoadenosine 5'-phosphosulfate sulfotransferase (PAPS reductase)/FAD synthetase